MQAVLDETMGLGADRGCERVSYQAHDPQGNEDTAATLNMLINSVRFTEGIGTVGVFVPQTRGPRANWPSRQGSHRLRHTLVQRADHGKRSSPGQAVQPPAARLDRGRQGDPFLGERVAILAADGVERVELEQPRQALERADAQTEVLSIHDGEIKARKNDLDKAGTFTVDGSVTDASVGDYDALLLPGGTVNTDQLRVDKDAASFVRDRRERQARGGDLSRALDVDRGWRGRRSHLDVLPKHPHGSAQRRCGGR